MSKMPNKEVLLEELAKENLQVLMTAYMYAKGLSMYGEDVTRKILTATENAAMLDKAYSRGYYDAMDKAYNPEIDIHKWLNSFNTDSAPQCFNAVQELKKRLEADYGDGIRERNTNIIFMQ